MIRRIVSNSLCVLSVVAWADGPDFPVDYLESTGTQHVDIGLPSQAGLTAEIDFAFTSIDGNACILGAQKSASEKDFFLAYSGSVYFSYLGHNEFLSNVLEVNERHTVVCELSDSVQRMTLDGTEIAAKSYEGSLAEGPTLYMFAKNNNGTAQNAAKARIYSVRIWKGVKLVRDLKPVIHNKTTGYWDFVDGWFYPSTADLVRPEGTTPQTCTWTGKAGDHKWSTAENWDVKPVAGRGDTVILRSCSNGVLDLTPIDQDMTGMAVQEMRFGESGADGSAPVTLTGQSLKVTGATPWKCYETVSNYAPVVFTSTGTLTLDCGRTSHFFGDVTAVCSTLKYQRSLSAKAGDLYFHGILSAPTAELTSSAGMSCHLYGSSHLARVTSGALAANDYVYVHATGNDWPLAEISLFGRIFADVPNALPTNMVLSWHHDYPNANSQDQTFKVSGDQTVDRLAGDVPVNDQGEILGNRNNIEGVLSSVLTLKATANAVSYARCKGALSLVYDPVGSFVQELCDRTHLMTGTLQIKGGTLASCGNNVFPSVSRLTVGTGAVFRVAASDCHAAVNPFTGTTDLFLWGSGSVDVAAGVTVAFNRVFIDGMIVPVGTYQALDGTDGMATRVAWVKGEGLVSASFAGTSWKKSGAGTWKSAENWSNGVPGSGMPTYFDTTALGSCEAVMGEGDVWPTTVEMTGMGASIRVATGVAISYDGSDKESTLILRDGAVLKVDGTLALTNWVGTFMAESSNAALTSRVEVAGTLAFSPKSTTATRSYPLHLKAGGKLDVCGGMFAGYDTVAQPISMEGGALCASGAGVVGFEGIPARFVSGAAVFGGTSEVRWRAPSAFDTVWGPLVAGESLDVVFLDSARLAPEVDFQSVTIGGNADGGRTRVELASDVEQARLGYRAQVYGSGTGTAELVVSGGRVSFGGRGCDIACGGSDGIARAGRLTLLAGVVNNTADNKYWWDQYKPNGLTVAYGPSTAVAGEAGAVYGSVDISGGIFSNRTSVLLIGTGPNAQGVMRMTGGSFVNVDKTQIVGVGYAGGTGSLIVSNGVLDVAGDLYVGGSFTNVFTVNPERPYRNWPLDRHDAFGEFSVAGGDVTVRKDLVLGADGRGRLVRAGGTLTVAGDLICSNTVANVASGGELIFKLAGTEASDPVCVGGTFDVRQGARVVVRLSDDFAIRGRLPLVRAATVLGELSDLDVRIEGDAAKTYNVIPYLRNGVLGVRIQTGLLLIVR